MSMPGESRWRPGGGRQVSSDVRRPTHHEGALEGGQEEGAFASGMTAQEIIEKLDRLEAQGAVVTNDRGEQYSPARLRHAFREIGNTMLGKVRRREARPFSVEDADRELSRGGITSGEGVRDAMIGALMEMQRDVVIDVYADQRAQQLGDGPPDFQGATTMQALLGELRRLDRYGITIPGRLHDLDAATIQTRVENGLGRVRLIVDNRGPQDPEITRDDVDRILADQGVTSRFGLRASVLEMACSQNGITR